MFSNKPASRPLSDPETDPRLFHCRRAYDELKAKNAETATALSERETKAASLEAEIGKREGESAIYARKDRGLPAKRAELLALLAEIEHVKGELSRGRENEEHAADAINAEQVKARERANYRHAYFVKAQAYVEALAAFAAASRECREAISEAVEAGCAELHPVFSPIDMLLDQRLANVRAEAALFNIPVA